MSTTSQATGKDSRVHFLSRSLAELDPRLRMEVASQASSGRRISDVVYELLSESIRGLRLPPGTPLSEPAVAAWLDVSRSPVREAFKRLVGMGLVKVVPQVGSQVAPISLAEVEEAVFVRSALETNAFQRAIGFESLDLTDIEHALALNQDAYDRGDYEAFFASDELLHQNVFILAGLPRLWDLVRGTKLQLDRLRRLNLSTAVGNPDLMGEHAAIVEALRDRDEIKGMAVLHRHAFRILDVAEDHRQEFPSYFDA